MMKAFLRLTPLFLLVLLSGCASSSALISEDSGHDSEAAVIAPDALERGCKAAESISALKGGASSEDAAPILHALLEVPAAEVCWLAPDEACTQDTCKQKSAMGTLATLYRASIGLENATQADERLQTRFVEQLASAIDTLAEHNGSPRVTALSEGLPFEAFKSAYENCCADADGVVVGEMLEDSRAALQTLAIQTKLPDTLKRAEEALQELKSSKADKGAIAEKNKVRAKAIQKREQARLRSELQRRLLELQEAGERARRAAEIVRAARENPDVLSVEEPDSDADAEEEEVVAEAAPPADETYERLCRARGERADSERTSLRSTLDDVYCLIADAKAKPSVVPKSELKRHKRLYASLNKTAFELALEELRWALADPAGARALMEDVNATPLITKATKKRMSAQVKRVCTGQLTSLAKSDHEDIILAERWIKECFGKDASAQRKWHRKIASKLKNAILWQKRLAEEQAQQESAAEAKAAEAREASEPEAEEERSPAKEDEQESDTKEEGEE